MKSVRNTTTRFTRVVGTRYSGTVTNSANRASSRHPSVYHVLVYISQGRSTIEIAHVRREVQ